MPLQLPLPLPNNSNLQASYDERLRAVEANRFGIAGFAELTPPFMLDAGVSMQSGSPNMAFPMDGSWHDLKTLGSISFSTGVSGAFIVYVSAYINQVNQTQSTSPYIQIGLVLDGFLLGSTPVTGAYTTYLGQNNGVPILGVYGSAGTGPNADHEVWLAGLATPWVEGSPPEAVTCSIYAPSVFVLPL